MKMSIIKTLELVGKGGGKLILKKSSSIGRLQLRMGIIQCSDITDVKPINN